MTDGGGRRRRRCIVSVALLLTGGIGCGWPLTRFPDLRTDVAIRDADESRDVREDREARAGRLRCDVEAIAFERSHRRRPALERARAIIERRLGTLVTPDGTVALATTIAGACNPRA